jgi:hypothetical protein
LVGMAITVICCRGMSERTAVVKQNRCSNLLITLFRAFLTDFNLSD